jgi:hypothetical protein
MAEYWALVLRRFRDYVHSTETPEETDARKP